MDGFQKGEQTQESHAFIFQYFPTVIPIFQFILWIQDLILSDKQLLQESIRHFSFLNLFLTFFFSQPNSLETFSRCNTAVVGEPGFGKRFLLGSPFKWGLDRKSIISYLALLYGYILSFFSVFAFKPAIFHRQFIPFLPAFLMSSLGYLSLQSSCYRCSLLS